MSEHVEALTALLDSAACRPRINPIGQGSARCPAHDDQRASLRYRDGDTFPLVISCMAGCTPDEVLAALGTSWGRLLTGSDCSVTIPASFKLADTEIPDGLTPAQQVAAAEILHVFAERLAYGEDRAAPIGARWLAQRLGWTTPDGKPAAMSATRSLNALVRVGFLTDCGELKPRGKGNGTRSFIPGPLLCEPDPPRVESATAAWPAMQANAADQGERAETEPAAHSDAYLRMLEPDYR